MIDLAKLHHPLNRGGNPTTNKGKENNSTSEDTKAHLGDEVTRLDRDHLGVTKITEAAHHHPNSLEKDTSREGRKVGDHQ